MLVGSKKGCHPINIVHLFSAVCRVRPCNQLLFKKNPNGFLKKKKKLQLVRYDVFRRVAMLRDTCYRRAPCDNLGIFILACVINNVLGGGQF